MCTTRPCSAGALVLLLAASSASAGDYEFTLNGEPLRPEVHSLRGDPDHPAPGDLIAIHDYLLVLGQPGRWDFRIDWSDVATPLRRVSQGGPRLVAATIKDSGRTTFSKLDPADRKGLRGVRIAAGQGNLDPGLPDLDPGSCALTLDDGVRGSGAGLGLPESTRHVRLQGMTTGRLRHAMEGLPALWSLLVEAYGEKLDAAVLPGRKDLRLLSVRAKRLANSGALVGLPELRDLSLTLTSGAPDLAALRKLPELRRLTLTAHDLTDLSPLGGHPALRSLTVRSGALRALPTTPLPALRELDVMGTRLSDEVVAAFRKAHPECRVRHRLDQVLHEELQGVTRLRVRSGGTCHRDRNEERTLLEVTDPAELAAVVAGLRIAGPSPSCQCCGDPTFEFYRGDRLVAELGWHHGIALRWPGVWPYDGELTPESAAFLKALLARHAPK